VRAADVLAPLAEVTARVIAEMAVTHTAIHIRARDLTVSTSRGRD
jgi:hypothetical protein